jgi:hypothetical protein
MGYGFLVVGYWLLVRWGLRWAVDGRVRAGAQSKKEEV